MANEAQCHIDEEMDRLMSSIYDLRFQRNTLSPISRLPTEILAEIFVHGASRDHHQHHCPHTISVLPQWVNVSYVCRRWRSVALDCPTLWSYLFVAPQRWVDELLARSKQTSLKICLCLAFCYPLGESRPLMEKVADHAEHIQELRLHLCGDPNHGLDPLLRPCSCAPRLQVLEIRGYFFPLVQRIFNGETPSLRKLDVTEADMPWYSFQLSNLISLSVEKIRHPFRPTMVELLSTLSSMHDLVNLRLCDALPSAPPFLANADINLPRLSRLLIRAPLSTVVAFLSCVNTPPGAEMKLFCDEEDNTAPHLYFRLSSLLAQKFRSYKDQVPSVPTIRMLAINFDARFLFSASERDCDCYYYEDKASWGRNIPLQLSIHFGRTMTKLDKVHISSDICRSVCPEDVQSIHIHGLPFSSTFWESALSHFQELHHLKVSACGISDLAYALSLAHLDDMESQAGYIGEGSRMLCAPGLEELELGYMRPCHMVHDERGISHLRTALSIRKWHGRTLKRFVMDNCADAFDLKDVLELPVGDVWMDGKRLLKSD